MNLTREDLPRVSVETLQDWQIMKAHYSRVALARLDARIAEGGLVHDRDTLHFHMNKFIENSFARAQPNLRVNGRNFEEVDGNEEEMEPFDESLDRHIWSLSDQRLQWDRKIADKRRTTPMQIEKLFQDYLSRQQKDDIEEMRMVCEGWVTTGYFKTDSESTTANSIKPLKRPVNVLAALDGGQLEDIFQKTSALAQELNQSIPAQQQRSNRIKLVEAEVKTLKP